MFKPNRMYSQINTETGSSEWFFTAREGVLGPYLTKELMIESMRRFVEDKIKAKDYGGQYMRGSKLSTTPLENQTKEDDDGQSWGGSKLSLVPIENQTPNDSLTLKRKRGIED